MGRLYINKDGKEVPSVTTILQNISSKELMKWANYLGFKRINYEDELDRTAARGTALHNYLEEYLKDPDNIYNYNFNNVGGKIYCETALSLFKSVMSKYDYTTIFTELQFVGEDFGGTVDWYANINDLNILLDIKSSRKVNIKHLLQLAAYRHLMKKEGYVIDAVGVLILNDRECRLYIVPGDYMDRLTEAFIKLKDYYILMENINIHMTQTNDIKILDKNKKEDSV